MQSQTVVPQVRNSLPLQKTAIGARDSSALEIHVMHPGAEKEAATTDALVDSDEAIAAAGVGIMCNRMVFT